MKESILAVLLVVCSYIQSQTLKTRISDVENGLTFQTVVEPGKTIGTKQLTERLRESKVPGASVAVVNNGEIEWSRGYGVIQDGSLDPVTTETLFQCASIGKVITALAALTLVEDGLVDLDEDINNKLQSWKIEENEHTAVQKVTLRHLLSHSSGLTDNYGFQGYDPDDEIPNLLQILNRNPPANTKKGLDIKTLPGKVERYSGAGYLIIQLLIEDVSETSFDRYVQQHIFNPLEMAHSTYAHQPDKELNAIVATGHHSNGKPLKNKRYNIYPEKGAAGPWTTAEDLAKLIIGIQDASKGESNSVLSKELTQEFLTAQINNKGLGTNLKGVEKPEAFWHAGQNLGYTALLYGLTDDENGAVILLNSDGGERVMQEFITSVAHAYIWPVMKSYQSLKIPEELRTKLLGKYVSDDQSKILSIELKRESLVVKSPESKKGYQLYRIGGNAYTFKNAQDYYKLSFKFESDRTVLTYSESIGKTLDLKKVE